MQQTGKAECIHPRRKKNLIRPLTSMKIPGKQRLITEQDYPSKHARGSLLKSEGSPHQVVEEWRCKEHMGE
jgi:hypothetical protein